MTDQPNYLDTLRSKIGMRGGPRRAKDPVSECGIRIWCEAVGDENPTYQDRVWADRSRFRGIVAPAASLNMWTLPGNRRVHSRGEPLDLVNDVLNAEGFTSVAAVNNEHEYLRPLRPGDHLSQIQYISDVSDEKYTALGRGHFIGIANEFITDDEELVGRVLLRILKWNPETEGSRNTKEPTSVSSELSSKFDYLCPLRSEVTRSYENVRVGTELPLWVIPVTQSLIATLAVATFDYNDVHLDRDAAIKRGARDVYMNILGSTGLVNRYITDWAGPETVFKSIRAQLHKQNHPGDTMTLEGRVTEKEQSDGEGLVIVDVRGRNSLGDHLVATCTITLPMD